MSTAEHVRIAVHEWGCPEGPPIVFVHGAFSSHLTWDTQVHGTLARDFRLIAYDLRGHGASDKPLDPDCYAEPSRWADELRSVVVDAELSRPVLVGWS